MGLALLGKKLGMTQIFDEEGYCIPVTVISTGPCTVLQKKSKDGKDGYNALKIGYGSVKPGRMTKPELGFFKKHDLEPKRHLREIRVSDDELSSYEVGQDIKLDLFSAGDRVDVIGISKGRGFTGVIKRHGFKGMKATHGTHEYFRHGGSIGCSAWPAKVFKGKKMPGQHGNVRVTTERIRVVNVDTERNEIWLRGTVPGPTNSIVMLRPATKQKK